MWQTIGLIFILSYSVVLFFIIFSAFSAFLRTRVPFVPTHSRDIQLLAEKITITDADTIWDLGSGTGTVVFAFEKHSPAQVKGFERGLWMYLYAKLQKGFTHSRAQFTLGNFFDSHWADATVIYCYLYPPLMRQIGEKVLAECKPGTRIISRDFHIPNLEEKAHIQIDDIHEFFIYEI